MGSVILDYLPLQIDREQLKKRLRIKEGSGMGEKVEALVRKLRQWAGRKPATASPMLNPKGMITWSSKE